jgi:large subunit ribosomal protein L15
MPLFRRLPKRGFTNRNSKEIIVVNVAHLEKFEDGTVVTPELLLETGVLAKLADGVKVLGKGELTKKLTVKVNAVSESAKAKIEAAGGSVEVI